MNLIIFFLNIFSLILLTESTIVQTQYGPVEGRIRTTENGISYHSFQGIPYATPLTESLRFRVSVQKARV